MIKVSIIVPIYNVEKYLEKSIKSLLNQTLKEIQIILVNDGATDNCAEIAKKYANENPEKILYLEKENGGLSDARNFGLPYAKGEYIAFSDPDDYVEKNMYEEMYNKAKEENSDFIDCNFLWEYPNKIKKSKQHSYTNKKEMLINARVEAWNKLIKREIIEKNQIVFPKGLIYEDVEFTYKIIPYIQNPTHIDKEFIHYVQRQNSYANTQNEMTAQIFKILENVIQYYKEKEIYEDYKSELEYIYTRILLCSSFKRICKIANKEKRKEILNKTWENLNTEFPNWKKNEILTENKNFKNFYLKTVNKFTFKIYAFILEII